jgi:hypothetical protein
MGTTPSATIFLNRAGQFLLDGYVDLSELSFTVNDTTDAEACRAAEELYSSIFLE